VSASLQILVNRLKNGDKEAFDLIYENTHRQIFFVVLPIVNDRLSAEDIVQDTYIKFLENIENYRNKNLLAYLITIGKNLAINEYHKKNRIVKVENFDDFAYSDLIEYKVEAQEAIQKALSILDNQERNIFLLHVLESLTFKEIALIINKPIGTVTWMYQKARRKMKVYLRGEDYE
jgi:RNA polymerase sigma-70 factor (ECF subfamily)